MRREEYRSRNTGVEVRGLLLTTGTDTIPAPNAELRKPFQSATLAFPPAATLYRSHCRTFVL
jgi:hypothetical protein